MPAGLIILGFMLWGIWKLFGYILLLIFICFAPAPQPVEVPEPPVVEVVEEDPDMAELDRLIKEAEAEFAIHGGTDGPCDGPN